MSGAGWIMVVLLILILYLLLSGKLTAVAKAIKG
jgi:hypothetical protein